jgi:hypothetical protein
MCNCMNCMSGNCQSCIYGCGRYYDHTQSHVYRPPIDSYQYPCLSRYTTPFTCAAEAPLTCAM